MEFIDMGARNEILKELTDLAHEENITIIGVENTIPHGYGVMTTVIYHDDWCPCSDGNHGMSNCICKPDVVIVNINGQEIG